MHFVPAEGKLDNNDNQELRDVEVHQSHFTANT